MKAKEDLRRLPLLAQRKVTDVLHLHIISCEVRMYSSFVGFIVNACIIALKK